MKKLACLILFSGFLYCTSAQPLHLGIFGGISAYNGDLTEKIFPGEVTNLAGGLTVNYEISDQFILKAGFIYTVVGGADKYSDKPDFRLRNLSFETTLSEFSLTGEYYLFSLYKKRFSPYGFAGLAVFHFNPYTYEGLNNRVFLKPLSTEGQGLSAYPDRKPYQLTQLAIPFGAGLKFALNDNLHIGIEGGLRKLFTDYLDDVSTNYIDQADLLSAKGHMAVSLSYRSDEAGGNPAYPAKNTARGSPKSKDYYYFTGIHITHRLATGGGRGRNHSHTGCPVNVW